MTDVDTMRPDAKELYEAIRNAHSAAVQLLVPMNAYVKAGDSSPPGLADLAYALRECRDFAKDVAKRCDELGKLAQRVACMRQLVENGTSDSIVTQRCVAVLGVRSVPAVPSKTKNPEQWAQLMDYLGVPRGLHDGLDKPVVDTNWPGLVQRLSDDLAAGKPLPPGIDPTKTFPEYSLNIRGKERGVAG